MIKRRIGRATLCDAAFRLPEFDSCLVVLTVVVRKRSRVYFQSRILPTTPEYPHEDFHLSFCSVGILMIYMSVAAGERSDVLSRAAGRAW